MFPENTASVALHESLGFRLVGRFERVAQLDGVWRDTVLLEPPPVERYAASSQRRNTTHALCPPKPNEFDTREVDRLACLVRDVVEVASGSGARS